MTKLEIRKQALPPPCPEFIAVWTKTVVGLLLQHVGGKEGKKWRLLNTPWELLFCRPQRDVATPHMVGATSQEKTVRKRAGQSHVQGWAVSFKFACNEKWHFLHF